MAGLSALAIFWLTFAAFIGPVFLIALVCSIKKAIRTRRSIIRRLQMPPTDQSPPIDSEIISDGVRRKPNIKLIEDEARKKEFRGTTGSLLYANSVSKARKLKDTDVDRQAGNMNKSNKAGGDVINSNASDAFRHDGSSSSNKNHHNNVVRSKHRQNNNCNNIRHDAIADNDIVYSNGVTGSVNNGRAGVSRRRKSMGDGISASSYTAPKSNGHVISEGTYHKGASTLYKHDINHPGLKPDSYNNRSRRHSINSSSPTLERIPEVKCVEVEMNTTRSKSEDNLIDQQFSSGPSPYLTTDGCGSDNQGFARSTETTIM